VRPIAAHAFISAPRADVFDFVADLANRVAYADHFLSGFRLARPKSDGEGAAARFAITVPCGRIWAETTIVTAEPPRRVVEQLRLGRLGRNSATVVYELTAEGEGQLRVDLTIWSEPATRLDAAREAIAGRRWLRRQSRIALERLRMIFEETPDAPLARATIAGYESAAAPRFGASRTTRSFRDPRRAG